MKARHRTPQQCYTHDYLHLILYHKVKLEYSYCSGVITMHIHVDWLIRQDGDVLVLYKPTSLGEDIKFNLKISTDFTWTLHSFRMPIDTSSCPVLQMLPSVSNSVSNVGSIITTLDNCSFCSGNDDEKFNELAKMRKGIFKDQSGMGSSSLVPRPFLREKGLVSTVCACSRFSWNSMKP